MGIPIPSVSCSQALWEHVVLPRLRASTLGVPCVAQPCAHTAQLHCTHIWDGDTDGSPSTPQEGSDTCTLLWAGVTEPPVIYFYTLYYNSCFYSFVPFVLCLVELHVPALPTAAQGPPGAA